MESDNTNKHKFCDSSFFQAASEQTYLFYKKTTKEMVQRSESSLIVHNPVNFTYIKIGGHVSDNFLEIQATREKKAWVQTFPRIKLEWTVESVEQYLSL